MMDTVYGTISQPFFVSSNTDLHKLPNSPSLGLGTWTSLSLE